jgi:hypothetical protein
VPIEKHLYRDLRNSDVGNEVPKKNTKFYQFMEDIMQIKQEKVFADLAQGAPSQGPDPDSRSLLDTLPRGVVTMRQRSNFRAYPNVC